MVTSAARELLNRSDNKRSGVLLTAMSFVGVCRDPRSLRSHAGATAHSHNLIEGPLPATLYLVVATSDISRSCG